MCDIRQSSKRVKGGLALEVTCAYSGKRIVTSNENGMYCEDHCGEAEDVAARAEFEKMFRDAGLGGLFKGR